MSPAIVHKSTPVAIGGMVRLLKSRPCRWHHEATVTLGDDLGGGTHAVTFDIDDHGLVSGSLDIDGMDTEALTQEAVDAIFKAVRLVGRATGEPRRLDTEKETP
jgi:hypothetical protein